MATVHAHYSTGGAYDACQTRDDHKDGDVLLIEDEQVVGLVGTWPCAVTKKDGKLHQAKPNHRTDDVLVGIKVQYGDPLRAASKEANIREGYRLAKQIARAMGWPLRPEDDN